MKDYLINRGSVQDIRDSLRLGNYSVADLEENLRLEMIGANRTTVIKMIESNIKRKRKEEQS